MGAGVGSIGTQGPVRREMQVALNPIASGPLWLSSSEIRTLPSSEMPVPRSHSPKARSSSSGSSSVSSQVPAPQGSKSLTTGLKSTISLSWPDSCQLVHPFSRSCCLRGSGIRAIGFPFSQWFLSASGAAPENNGQPLSGRARRKHSWRRLRMRGPARSVGRRGDAAANSRSACGAREGHPLAPENAR
jgi:hypothetical protein